MANSGLIVHRIHEYLDFEFVWVAAQDPAAGGSMIHWHTMLRAGEYGRIAAIAGSGWSTVIDGHTFSGGTDITIAANSAKELASGSVFLKHDPFGEKTFDFAYSQILNITYDGVYTGEITGSGTVVLDRLDPDIAPVLDKTRVYLGESLNITPKGPLGATYRLRYAMGDGEGIIGENVTGPVDWVVPVTLGEQIPYTDKGILRILCDAYRDGYPIGRTREAAVLALVPEDALPQITELTWEDESAAKETGLVIQNVSVLNVSANCEGAMGSRIMSCYIFLEEEPYSKGRLKYSGELTLTAIATDSRNRSQSASCVINSIPYQGPCVKVTAHRCTEDGLADDTGGFMEVSVAAVLSAFDGNIAALKLSAGSFSEEKNITEPQTLQWILEAPTESTIGIIAQIADLFGNSYCEMVLSTAYATVDLLYGGKGIAFGTTARQEGFWCAMDAHFTGEMHLGKSILLPDGTSLLERLEALETITARFQQTHVQ